MFLNNVKSISPGVGRVGDLDRDGLVLLEDARLPEALGQPDPGRRPDGEVGVGHLGAALVLGLDAVVAGVVVGDVADGECPLGALLAEREAAAREYLVA